MLKLFTKLGPDTVHGPPISFHVKIYLWSLVDYEHLQKYFYNWNITLNYCFTSKINIIGNFIYLEMSLIASNTHIATPLFHPLWKIVNNSKSYGPAVPVIMSFKVLKYFSSDKISFFFFASLWQQDLRLEKLMFFSEISTHTTIRLNRKRVVILRKNVVLWLEFALFGS